MTQESVLTAPPGALRTKPAPHRMAKFAVVGGWGAVLNTVALYAMYEWLHTPLVIASAVAVELAVINNFLLNDRWTFAARSRSLGRFVKFNMCSLGGAAVNVLSLRLFTGLGLHLVLANLVGIAAGFAVNFVLSSTWVWGAA